MTEDKEDIPDKNGNESSKSNLVQPIADLIADIPGEGVQVVLEEVAKPVVDFLVDKFRLATDTATEVASQLPQAVIDKIENFKGEGLNDIMSSVTDSLKSIELPDIEFPDIDF